MNQSIQSLMNFLDNSPYAYKASQNIASHLEEAGFLYLHPQDSWKLESGKAYYTRPQDFSGILAFRVGEKKEDLRLIATHTDSPSLKLKLESTREKKPILNASIEIYGGPIYATWLDRDLSLGGILYTKEGNSIKRTEIDFKSPIGMIPNLAIHLNREINASASYNAQTHMKVIYGLESADSLPLQKKLEEMIGGTEILGADLFFYDTQKASLSGLNEEFLSSGRLDNLAMCHSTLEALLKAPATGINMGIFFDNEEIGSMTSGGAYSSLLMNTIERMYKGLGINREEMLAILSSTAYLISADMSHAFHPSYTEKFDPDYAPILGKGPVIKSHANFKYGTTGYSEAFFKMICQEADIPYQNFLIRSDLVSGSTIGAMTNAFSGIRTIDIGSPLWAMHSIRETVSVQDHLWMTKVLAHFFTRSCSP